MHHISSCSSQMRRELHFPMKSRFKDTREPLNKSLTERVVVKIWTIMRARQGSHLEETAPPCAVLSESVAERLAKRGLGQRGGAPGPRYCWGINSPHGVASSSGSHGPALCGRTIRLVAFVYHPKKPLSRQRKLFQECPGSAGVN